MEYCEACGWDTSSEGHHRECVRPKQRAEESARVARLEADLASALLQVDELRKRYSSMDQRCLELIAEKDVANRLIRDLWWLLENEPSGPGEGMVSTAEDVRLQKEWAEKYEMVRAGLPIQTDTENPFQEPPLATPSQCGEWTQWGQCIAAKPCEVHEKKRNDDVQTCKVSWPGTKMDDSDRQYCGRPLPCSLHGTTRTDAKKPKPHVYDH